MRRGGFTMIELLLAVALTATIVAASIFAFTTASRIWRSGVETADSIHHGDYVMEQLASALRSAYYPDAARPSTAHGFILEDDGEDDNAHDSISWVKMGPALVGGRSGIAGTPHRIVVTTLAEGESSDERLAGGGLAVKAWRLSSQVEDFDPEDEEYVKTRLIEPDVLAMDFKVLDPEGNLAEGKDPIPDEDEEDGGLNWFDSEEDWKDDYTNRLPYAVMATLYLKPTEKGADPIALRRLIVLPTAPLSWRDKGAAGGSKGSSDGGNKSRDRGKNNGRSPQGGGQQGGNGSGGGGGATRPGGSERGAGQRSQ